MGKTLRQKTSVDLWALVSSFGKKRKETKVDDGTHSFYCSVIYIFNDVSSKIRSDILNVFKKIRDG